MTNKTNTPIPANGTTGITTMPIAPGPARPASDNCQRPLAGANSVFAPTRTALIEFSPGADGTLGTSIHGEPYPMDGELQ
ncbi:MAG: hypothetical protein GY765_27255 [bacterium]|nr:hypothetical protein [bacterium]